MLVVPRYTRSDVRKQIDGTSHSRECKQRMNHLLCAFLCQFWLLCLHDFAPFGSPTNSFGIKRLSPISPSHSNPFHSNPLIWIPNWAQTLALCLHQNLLHPCFIVPICYCIQLLLHACCVASSWKSIHFYLYMYAVSEWSSVIKSGGHNIFGFAYSSTNYIDVLIIRKLNSISFNIWSFWKQTIDICSDQQRVSY